MLRGGSGGARAKARGGSSATRGPSSPSSIRRGPRGAPFGGSASSFGTESGDSVVGTQSLLKVGCAAHFWCLLELNVYEQIIRQSRTSGRLNLSNKGLTAIPDALFTREDTNPGISNVSLDRTDSDFNWWEEVDISKLIIADNKITDIDPRVTELGALTTIDAHNNALTALPDLSALQNLTILHLASNAITTIPDSLLSLPLAELHLSHNRLASLPDSIRQLGPTLVVLDLSHNLLESLPASLASALPLLTTLNLASNRLTSPPTFAKPCAVTNLDLSHNRLTSCGDLSACARLTILTASQNSLTKLFDAPLTLPSLVTLDVRVNRLATLDCEGSFPGLKELLISSNRLERFPAWLEGSLGVLETLDMRDNAFATVPTDVVRMPKLARLFVEGNPIRFPRRSVVEKGTASILKYLSERQPDEGQ
ncbi:Leucine-rich repeat-containing protein 40 [Irineochytrium annulatum]|nr:Leucine-rich repeat-containing protein 40 [Irineochytrium annulatum]